MAVRSVFASGIAFAFALIGLFGGGWFSGARADTIVRNQCSAKRGDNDEARDRNVRRKGDP